MTKRTINPENWVDDEITFKVNKALTEVTYYNEKFKVIKHTCDDDELNELEEYLGCSSDIYELIVHDSFSVTCFEITPKEWYAHETGISEGLSRSDKDPINAMMKLVANIY